MVSGFVGFLLGLNGFSVGSLVFDLFWFRFRVVREVQEARVSLWLVWGVLEGLPIRARQWKDAATQQCRLRMDRYSKRAG